MGVSAGASQAAWITPGWMLVRLISPSSRGPSVCTTEEELPTSAIVMATESEVATMPSLTVRVNVIVVLESTGGAVNRVEGAVASARVMLRAGSWDHR